MIERIDSFYNVRMYQAYIDEEEMYTTHYNCVLKSYKQGGRYHTDTVLVLEDCEKMNNGLFYSIIKVKDYLILIPGGADAIVLLNQRNGDISTYKINPPNSCTAFSKVRYDESTKFFNGFSKNGCAYLLGDTYPGIIKLDVNSEKITYITDWINTAEILEKGGNSKCLFSNGYALREDFAYLAIATTPAIMRLNLLDDSSEIYELPSSFLKIHGVTEYNNTILIVAEKKNHDVILGEWNENDGITPTATIMSTGGEKIFWWDPIVFDDVFLIISSSNKLAYLVRKDGYIVEKCHSLLAALEDFPKEHKQYWLGMGGNMSGKFLVNSVWNQKWYEYNPKTGETKEFYLVIDEQLYTDNFMNEFWKDIYIKNKGKILDENNFPLLEFLKNI